MKKEKNKKKPKIYKTTILFIVLDIIVAACFFITYGPYDKLRNLFVTTAMKTMSHQYLAKVFYSDETIQKIMDSNYFTELNEDTNTDDIIFDNEDTGNYKNEYDKQILQRDEGALYKVLDAVIIE